MPRETLERLYLDGKLVYMASNPILPYLISLPQKLKFHAMSNDCWKGYAGTWEIKNGKLFLISFFGQLDIPDDYSDIVDISFLFPKQREVFAYWVTGELRIPQGSIIKESKKGWSSIYESDLLIKIDNGIVIGQRTVDNTEEFIVDMAKEIINKKKEITLINSTTEVQPQNIGEQKIPLIKESLLHKIMSKLRIKK